MYSNTLVYISPMIGSIPHSYMRINLIIKQFDKILYMQICIKEVEILLNEFIKKTTYRTWHIEEKSPNQVLEEIKKLPDSSLFL